MKTKLRNYETLGFRPENEAQEKLIRDAQTAAGLKMSELLRRAVLMGLPALMAEIREQQEAAFSKFESAMKETHDKEPPKRKAG